MYTHPISCPYNQQQDLGALSLTATAPCRYGDNVWRAILGILSAVLVDFLLLGLIIATAGW